MPKIDEQRPFKPVNIAVMTVSDSRAEENDTSGKALAALIARDGHHLAARIIVKDEQLEIVARLKAWIADPTIDVVISTGGTGVTGRDVTPEAFQAVFEKEIPGFGEMLRAISLKTVGLSAIQSRATAGVAGATLIFAIPGSTGACRDAWDEILVHQLDSRYRPCNLVEMLPRLGER